MKKCAPKIDPADKLQIVGRIRLLLKDREDCLVKNSDRSFWHIIVIFPWYRFEGNALTSDSSDAQGLSPEHRENECGHERRKHTSDTPYWLVVSIKSNEKAMPGRTLRTRY